MNLPDFLLLELATPPSTGQGVHQWIYRMARQLHAHLPEDQMIALLEGKTESCGRCVPRREIEEAVVNSRETAWRPGQKQEATRPARPRWPEMEPSRIATLEESEPLEMPDLWEMSPFRLPDEGDAQTELIVDRLFPDDALLCCGRTMSDFDTLRRDEWRGRLSAMQLIVPSPMCARQGRRKSDGKLSTHTLENTGSRRFLVIEFDQGSTDQHATILWALAREAPLVMVVHSGGKSLHGWFFCSGQDEARLRGFMRYCVRLGADPATWTRSQFVRMPDGQRNNGRRQSVLYFHPQLLQSHS